MFYLELYIFLFMSDAILFVSNCDVLKWRVILAHVTPLPSVSELGRDPAVSPIAACGFHGPEALDPHRLTDSPFGACCPVQLFKHREPRCVTAMACSEVRIDWLIPAQPDVRKVLSHPFTKLTFGFAYIHSTLALCTRDTVYHIAGSAVRVSCGFERTVPVSRGYCISAHLYAHTASDGARVLAYVDNPVRFPVHQ